MQIFVLGKLEDYEIKKSTSHVQYTIEIHVKSDG